MLDDVRQAMLAYIEVLRRVIAVDDSFADDLFALVDAIEDEPHLRELRGDMLSIARHHRVGALKCRTQLAAVTRDYEGKFGPVPPTPRPALPSVAPRRPAPH